MTISGPTRVVAAVAAATALAVSTAPAEAGPRLAADGPDYGAPTVGSCSTMTPRQADHPSDRSTVVPCSKAHTAKVAGVVRLPKGVDYTSSPVRVYRAMVDRCRPRFDSMLGRSAAVRDSSAYDLVWFVPTAKQQQHGARWLSCSVVLRQGARLAKLPTDKTPMLPSGRLGRGIQRCLLADTSRVVTTRCSSRHGWHATGAFVIASKRYPGRKAVNRRAASTCVSRVQSGKPYRWTYWTKINWQVGGDHAVICYSKTTR
ncbi:MAG TPA: septum formation family protein [Nocardioides sp.]|jgi:hypothetical protein|nr:septum formation family protein [Nocardioides sp.]